MVCCLISVKPKFGGRIRLLNATDLFMWMDNMMVCQDNEGIKLFIESYVPKTEIRVMMNSTRKNNELLPNRPT